MVSSTVLFLLGTFFYIKKRPQRIACKCSGCKRNQVMKIGERWRGREWEGEPGQSRSSYSSVFLWVTYSIMAFWSSPFTVHHQRKPTTPEQQCDREGITAVTPFKMEGAGPLPGGVCSAVGVLGHFLPAELYVGPARRPDGLLPWHAPCSPRYTHLDLWPPSVWITLNIDYNGTPLKGHPWNEDTSLIRTLDQVPTSYKYVLFAPWNEDTSLIRTLVLFTPWNENTP